MTFNFNRHTYSCMPQNAASIWIYSIKLNRLDENICPKSKKLDICVSLTQNNEVIITKVQIALAAISGIASQLDRKYC